MAEYMKVEKVEAGVAVGTFRCPVEHLDSVMSLADNIIHAARFLKVRSRVLLATSAASSPSRAALVLAARAELARSESAKRAARRLAAKNAGIPV